MIFMRAFTKLNLAGPIFCDVYTAWSISLAALACILTYPTGGFLLGASAPPGNFLLHRCICKPAIRSDLSSGFGKEIRLGERTGYRRLPSKEELGCPSSNDIRIGAIAERRADDGHVSEYRMSW